MVATRQQLVWRAKKLVKTMGYPLAQSLREQLRIPFDNIAALSDRYDYHKTSLGAAELHVFSQNGEDGVIAEILNRIGTATRHFVDFGAGHGWANNTTVLSDILGWSGVLIEPGHLFSALEEKYRFNERVRTAEEFVTPSNINELFSELGIPFDVDVMSIDVDGQEYWLWKALTVVRPRLVVLEYNSALADDQLLVEPRGRSDVWDGTDYFGASIGALRHLADEKDYTLVHQELTGVNAFFVRNDLMSAMGEIISVPRRPNFSMVPGKAHPHDTEGRSFLNLEDQ